MAIFKCKMCGAALEVNNETTATCEYCGTAQTLPKLNDEKIANLYDRANHFRRNNEYDKAMGIFEQILDEDTKDAEAYWSLVLCKYGIEYVEDPVTRKRVPTVNRTQFTSVFDDDNYKKALGYADVVQKRLYEEEAKTINDIQKGILAISNQEAPFDVFICYKETDSTGRRTMDSVLAQELYNELTKEGFNVFFSRITLEDKLGTAYEPYIFAALNSAKVMVVVGTKPEHFNAVWVKNEWSRYLGLIKGGAKKTLIPAYKDMDPYDLPYEFSHLQAQDMNKLGFMQDLVRGIKKIIGKDEKPQAVATEKIVEKTTAHTMGSSSVEALLTRVFMFLEDKEWANANEYCERVLDIDPKNGYAYLGKLMVELELQTKEEFADINFVSSDKLNEYRYRLAGRKIDAVKNKNLDEYVNYQKIIRFGDEQLVAEMKEYNNAIIENGNNSLKALVYDTAKRYMEDALRKDQIDDGIACFIEAAKHFETMPDYKDSKKLAEKCREQIEVLPRERSYKKAEMLMSMKKYEEAVVEYQKADGWNDAEEKILLCQKIIAEEEAKEKEEQRKAAEIRKEHNRKIELERIEKNRQAQLERIEKERQEAIAKQKAAERAEKRKKTLKIVVPIALIIAVIAIVMTTVVIPNANYDKAISLMESGKYEEAIAKFEKLDGHKDSDTKIVECNEAILNKNYNQAVAMLNEKNYKEAFVILSTMYEYKDSYQLMKAALGKNKLLGNSLSFTYGSCFTGVRSDGTVMVTGSNKTGQCKLDDWENIKAVSPADGWTVGLNADGTVKVAGTIDATMRDILESWNDIVVLSAEGSKAVGVKRDGTVVDTSYGKRDIEEWTDIVDISIGSSHVIGVKADGTVIATGSNLFGECNVEGWTNIVAISTDDSHTVGLKADGTVVATGSNSDGECNVGDWRDIVAISAGQSQTVGLKKDGTVVAVGDNYHGACDVNNWEYMIDVITKHSTTFGLKADGTIVATGINGARYAEDLMEWNLFR